VTAVWRWCCQVSELSSADLEVNEEGGEGEKELKTGATGDVQWALRSDEFALDLTRSYPRLRMRHGEKKERREKRKKKKETKKERYLHR